MSETATMPAADGPPEGCAPGTILLDRYRVEGLIANGAMGHILRATRLDDSGVVAVKLLHESIPIVENSVHRFLREAKSVSRLRSEHATRILDIGTTEEGRPFMVMELLEGSDLCQLLLRHGRVSIAFAVEVILQACDALAEAHAIRIFHRDLKPANLFLATQPDGQSRVKVLDFGVSKTPESVDYSLTSVHAMVGTPQYMSPEQTQLSMIDARSDIWALGAVLYELVEGVPPFYSDNFAEVCSMIAFEPPRPAVYGKELAPVIDRCLQKDPADRYQNVADLANDLARFVMPSTARPYLARIHRVLGRSTGESFEDSITPVPARNLLAQMSPGAGSQQIPLAVPHAVPHAVPQGPTSAPMRMPSPSAPPISQPLGQAIDQQISQPMPSQPSGQLSISLTPSGAQHESSGAPHGSSGPHQASHLAPSGAQRAPGGQLARPSTPRLSPLPPRAGSRSTAPPVTAPAATTSASLSATILWFVIAALLIAVPVAVLIAR